MNIKIICTIILTTIVGYAQKKSNTNLTKGSIEIGSTIGSNTTGISSKEGSSELKNGGNYAATFDYYFNNRWSFKSKFIYDQKGWDNGIITVANFNDPNPILGTDYITNFRLNYLTIPLMANWHFGSTRKWFLNFGPYFSFLLDAKDSRFSIDVTNQVNSTDIGLQYGIGYKFHLNEKLRLRLEFEGQSGFTDIINSNTMTEKTFKTCFMVGFSYMVK